MRPTFVQFWHCGFLSSHLTRRALQFYQHQAFLEGLLVINWKPWTWGWKYRKAIIVHTCRLYTQYALLGNDGLFAGSALQVEDDNDWPTRHGVLPAVEVEELGAQPDQRSSRGGVLLVQQMISSVLNFCTDHGTEEMDDEG